MAVALIQTPHHYTCLSSDTKPASAPAGSTAVETDTGAVYVSNGSAWSLLNIGTPLFARKTATFTGAAGAGAVGSVALFTVTGEVLIERLVPFCSTLLTEAAPTATLALGVTGSTSLFVAATNATDIDANEFWIDTTPDANGIAVPAALKDIAITDNIIGTVAAQNVTAGVIRFDVYWRPLSSDGLLVAA